MTLSPPSYTIIYIIILFFGIMIGNLLTTVIYRLPRKISLNGIFNKKFYPFCSTCKHPLKFYEYFPILSWIFSGRSCNYCGAKIPLIYTIVEITTGLAITLTYALKCRNDWNQINCQISLITSIYSITTILTIALYIVSGKIYNQIIITSIWLGLVKQAMLTNSIDEHAIRLMIVTFTITLLLVKKQDLFPNIISIGGILSSWNSSYPVIIITLSFYTITLHYWHDKEKIQKTKTNSNISSPISTSYPLALFITYIITAWL